MQWLPGYQCKWTELKGTGSRCVFTKGIDSLRAPIAHGEGRFVASEKTLDALEQNGQVAFRYAKDGAAANSGFSHNPNGSARDIAGVCDPSGRVFGMMPHSERNMFFVQQPDWPLQKERMEREGKSAPDYCDGLKVVENAVNHFT